MQSLKYRQFLLGALLLAMPGLAQANAGLPMLLLIMPAFAIALLPIILVESLYISRRLALSLVFTAKIATAANLVSTVAGIPLTWLILVVAQIATGGGGAYGVDTLAGKILAVTWQAPWLIPYENEMDWMIPVASIVLLVPFFFVSWWVEYRVTRKMLKNAAFATLKSMICRANLISYCLLVCWPAGMLALNHGAGV